MKKIIYTSIFLLSVCVTQSVSAQVMCTADAKMCPDGTFVGRTGPNCEFTACPNTQPVPDQPAPTFCPNLYSTLRIGQTNTQVKELQSFLFTRYKISTKPTGYFGFITRNYVMKFQTENALAVDGIVGPATRTAVKNVCQASVPTLPVVAPANCKVWFDGCNNCARGVEGGPLACTMMACLWANQQAAMCKEYF